MSQIFYLLFTNVVFSISFLPRYFEIIYFSTIKPHYFCFRLSRRQNFMLLHVRTAASRPLTVLNQNTTATQLWLTNQNRNESFHCWLFTAVLVFFLSQEVPGGVLLHHHREEQPPHAACGPQLCSGWLCRHQHQPSGQLLSLRPLPAQEVSGRSSAGPCIKLLSCTFWIWV